MSSRALLTGEGLSGLPAALLTAVGREAPGHGAQLAIDRDEAGVALPDLFRMVRAGGFTRAEEHRDLGVLSPHAVKIAHASMTATLPTSAMRGNAAGSAVRTKRCEPISILDWRAAMPFSLN
ncbi:hypothetical protein BES08_27695 (plasmid) [Novosphingobium resinovorum]|uniref:Uncharacterized protein n=1 Tax=Novosphingobium resinovorum TaxID=158500 RepID=A0A1D8AES4_9SPHN|nr:hypothetical protein BES08_27695 [Novosphingobium resinovorum]